MLSVPIVNLLFLLLPAQIRQLEITFTGVNCAPCLESMPGRAQRIRGVESAKVDAEKGTLALVLAETNRVRVEQIRDLIQQDGTKAGNVTRIVVRGTVEKQDGMWLLRVPQHPLPLELSGGVQEAGEFEVTGTIADLQRAPRLRIDVTSVKK